MPAREQEVTSNLDTPAACGERNQRMETQL
jgi:hypothetical protein